jgi:hypothetical protein
MIGLTFDTGALLALERRNDRISSVWRMARKNDVTITVPSAVVTEWWRGRSDRREDILAGVDVEDLDRDLAQLAGKGSPRCRAPRASTRSSWPPPRGAGTSSTRPMCPI